MKLNTEDMKRALNITEWIPVYSERLGKRERPYFTESDLLELLYILNKTLLVIDGKADIKDLQKLRNDIRLSGYYLVEVINKTHKKKGIPVPAECFIKNENVKRITEEIKYILS